MASQHGDFDNFTYVNVNNLSELGPPTDCDYENAGHVRPQTELLDLKNSFNVVLDQAGMSFDQ